MLMCAILSFKLFITGFVGLSCLVLAFLTWKLEQGRANEHASEDSRCMLV